MTWSEAESRRRVREFLQQAPEVKGALPDYSGGDLRSRHRLLLEQSGVSKSAGPLDRLSAESALVIDGVHVYVRLLGFEDQLIDQQRETEASHRRALIFLHFYYAMLDRIVRDGGGVRVDFHGARMHFVVAEPIGSANLGTRIERAFAIVEALEVAAANAPGLLGYTIARSPLRIGMDQGPCIAIANDNGHEMDPVFLGTPANFAAKLAEGDTPGIYASQSIRANLGLTLPSGPADAMRFALPDVLKARFAAGAGTLATRATDELVELKKIAPEQVTPPNFVFHRARLPLANVKFADLQPSNSIRMEMAALFADLDQFTAYVDRSLKSGAGRQVVRTIFVVREEQRAVLKQDFGSKRLRFVGDCVIGLHAEGTATETNASTTVESAVRCAAALHASLDICRQEVPGAEPLGLQVGVAFGASPITRLGIRGDMSVRCAASKAIIEAERQQRLAERGETALSQSALDASTRLRKLANGQRSTVRGPFTAIDAMLSGAPLSLGAAASATASSRPAAAAPFRAHSGGDD